MTAQSILLPVPAVELGSAVYHALSKLGDKFGDRDQLTDGETYRVDCQIAGSVNGHPFTLPVDATLTVGHESMRASSVTPHVNDILAIILGFVSEDTRRDLIEYLLDEYKATGKLKADEAQLAIVDEMLSHMRQATNQPVRGSVKLNTKSKDSPLSIAVA